MRSFLLPVILTVLLAVSSRQLFSQSNGALLWEEDIRKFEHLDSTEIYPDDAILFVGSSSIRLWATLAQDMEPFEVIQRGYGGAKLSDLTVFAERIVYPHPSKAIVLFVANDITGNDEDKSAEEVEKLFRDLLATIRRKYPETPVFWIATTPTPLRWPVWPEIASANHRIENACKEYDNTCFIRTDSAFLGKTDRPVTELFQADSLHLNAQGYTVWKKIIKGELERVLGGNNTPVLP